MKKGNKTILENLVSLFSIRTMEYILGFVTLPYLMRTIGVERYGAIAFAQSFSQYFGLIITYAFNMTAPKNIAMNKDIMSRKEIFSSVCGAKIFLFSIVSIVYMVLIFCIPVFYHEKGIYISVFFTLIGDILFPVWFFQGIEKMRYITYVNVVARLITVGLIFVLVNSPEDTVLTAFLQSITNVIAGIFSIGIIWWKYRQVLSIPSWSGVKRELVDGWQLFYSTVAVSLYTGSNTFFLGVFTDTVIVGYFSGAQKLMQAAKSIIDTAAAAIYPHTSALLAESKNLAIDFLRIWLKRLYLVGFMISFFSFLFADSILHLLLGPQYEFSITIFRILIWIPFIVTFTNIFLVQTLVPFGWSNLYSRIVAGSAIINLVIIFPCIYFAQAVGVAWAMLFTEIYVAVMSWWCVNSKGINYFRR